MPPGLLCPAWWNWSWQATQRAAGPQPCLAVAIHSGLDELLQSPKHISEGLPCSKTAREVAVLWLQPLFHPGGQQGTLGQTVVVLARL